MKEPKSPAKLYLSLKSKNVIEKTNKQYNKHNSAFTIVELLIVIVVIAILAAITVVAYNGIQTRARTAKIQSDLSTLSKAVQAARVNEGKTMLEITGSGYTATGCMSKSVGTDLAALPKTDTCWSFYLSSLQKISDASGINVANMVDPWGRPYFINENEGENGSCNRDVMATYKYPFDKTFIIDVIILIPLSGFSVCS